MISAMLNRFFGKTESNPPLAVSTMPALPLPPSEVESYRELGVPSGKNRHLIPGWYERGLGTQATHLVIRHDPLYKKDFPLYLVVGDAIEDTLKLIAGENAIFTAAVYNYREPLELQEERNTGWNP